MSPGDAAKHISPALNCLSGSECIWNLLEGPSHRRGLTVSVPSPISPCRLSTPTRLADGKHFFFHPELQGNSADITGPCSSVSNICPFVWAGVHKLRFPNLWKRHSQQRHRQFWKWGLLFIHQMLIEHVQGTRNWEDNHGQPPWFHGHATPCFCTDRGRGGGGKPTLALIMLDGPALPQWSVIFYSVGGAEGVQTGPSRSASLLFPVWTLGELSQPEHLLDI